MNTITTEQKIQQQLLRIQNGRREVSVLFTSAVEKLNQGLPGTNSTSGQNPNHWAVLPPNLGIILILVDWVEGDKVVCRRHSSQL